MTEPDGTDPKKLWQSQATEVIPMSLDDIHKHAKAFQSRLFRRNLREFSISAFAIPLVAALGVWYPDMIMRAGFMLILLSLLFYVYVLHTRGYADLKAVSIASENCLTFHKTALARNRDLYNSLWLWGILPAVPGFSVIFWRTAHLTSAENIRFYTAASLAVALPIALIAYSQFRARKMDEELKSLGG